MMCLFADLSLRFDVALSADCSLEPASRYQQVGYPPVHTNFIARPDLGVTWTSVVRAKARTWRSFYRDCYSNPIAADLPRRCQPLVTRISQSLKMRPTGEASKPVSGDFDCRPIGTSSSVDHHRPIITDFAPPPHRASQLRGFVAVQPHGSIT